MSKTKVKYTNHRDRSKIGSVIEVDAGRAKQLIRDGLAVMATTNAKVESKPETAKTGSKSKDEAK